MNVKPLHEKLMVLPFPPEQKTSGGIFIPDTAQERPSKATVIATGNGLKDRPMEMMPGDIVFHVKNAGVPIDIDGEVHYILRDADILCRIPKS
jgi:chaperonin GroES